MPEAVPEEVEISSALLEDEPRTPIEAVPEEGEPEGQEAPPAGEAQPDYTPDEFLSGTLSALDASLQPQNAPGLSEIEAMNRRLEETNRRLDQAITPQAEPKSEEVDYSSPAMYAAIEELPADQRAAAMATIVSKQVDARVSAVEQKMEEKLTSVAQTSRTQQQRQMILDQVGSTLDGLVQNFPGDEWTAAVARDWKAKREGSMLGRAFEQGKWLNALTPQGIQGQATLLAKTMARLHEVEASTRQPTGQPAPVPADNGAQAPASGSDAIGTRSVPRSMELDQTNQKDTRTEADKLLDEMADRNDYIRSKGGGWII